MLKIVQDIEAEVWSRFLAEVPIRFCGYRLINILSQTFGQDLEAEV